MKTKISVSIDAETVKAIDAKLEDGLFRNKSHFIEYAVRKVLNES